MYWPEVTGDIRRYVLKVGDIVIAMDGSLVGRSFGALSGHDVPALLLQRVARVRSSEVDVGYLKHWICSERFTAHCDAVKTTTAIPHISPGDIRSFKVAVPPTNAEQRQIGRALSDADSLIDSLEQLLTKKRQIKQGAMQELLTGKRRLPGFSGPWMSCTWGEVIDACSSGATPLRSRPDYFRGSIRWISSGELNYNVIDDTIEHISSEAFEKTNLKLHPAGTFLMAITGLEAEGTRGACGIVGRPAATNQSCMAIYPSSKLLTAYLFHYYVHKGDDLALRYCQGTKQQSYTAALVRVLPIEYPESRDEQLAIAQALSDINAEIAALESRLTKARALKQAMAQALLTGRIRIPLDPQEPAGPVPPPKGVGALGSGPARTQEPTP